MNILKTDKFPYLLTLLFALTTWCVTKIANNMLNKGILEYSYEVKTGYVQYNVTNISDKLMKNISFRLAYPGNIDTAKDGITNAAIFTLPPASKENIKPLYDEVNHEYASYSIPLMQPDWKYVLAAEVKGSLMPELYFNSDETIILQKRGFQTYVVKNQNALIMVLLLIWIVLIVLYFIFLGKKEDPKPTSNEK